MAPVRRRDNVPQASRSSSPIPDDPKPEFLPGWSRAVNHDIGPVIHRGRVPGQPNDQVPPASPSLRRDEPEPIPADRDGVISPSLLPGVRAIPPSWNRVLRGRLSPGQYFAKSLTRYLGPFHSMPTADDLPAGDTYVILQRMGRFPDTGKSIFRHVAQLNL